MPRPKRTRVGEPAARNNTNAPLKELPVSAAAAVASDDANDRRRSTRISSVRTTRSDDPARAHNSAQQRGKASLANSITFKAASSPTGRAGQRAAGAGAKSDNAAGQKPITTTSDDFEIEHSRHNPPSAARTGWRAAMARVDASGLDLDDDDDDDFGDLGGSLDDSRDLEEFQAGYASNPPSGYQSTDTFSFNTAILRRGRPRASSIAGKDDAPIRPSSRAGVSTPGIGSTINLGLFRRRPREPSILGTARKPQRVGDRQVPSSRQASEDEGGPDRPAGDDEEEKEEEEEDLDSDVAAALTPLDVKSPRRRSSAAKVVGPEDRSRGQSLEPRARKRKSLEEHESRGKRPAPNRAPNSEGDEDDDEGGQQEPDVHASIEAASSPSAHRPTRSRGRASDHSLSTPRGGQDENLDLLSIGSSSGSPVAWPSLEKLAQRHYNTKRAASLSHRTPEPANHPRGGEDDDDLFNISSPPSLTHSPNYRSAPAPKTTTTVKPRAKKASAQAQKKVTTADLTNLLPRRRVVHKTRRHRNPNDPYDLSSDTHSDSDRSVDAENESDEDDRDRDELSYHDSRAARRRKAGAPAAPSRPLSTTARGKQPQQQSSASSASAAGAHGRRKPPVRRTYGSHSSEKENEESGGGSGGEEEGEEEEEEEGGGQGDDGHDDGESFADQTATESTAPHRMGDELKKAKAKFLEVDRWQLEFESVTGSSSPMRDAR